MIYLVPALLLAALLWACRGWWPELRIELSKLTTCDHCGGSGVCGCARCRRVEYPRRRTLERVSELGPCCECRGGGA